MTIDPARDYCGGRDYISRKFLYNAVKRGLRVARTGATGRRMLFADTWIDEYLQQSAEPRVDHADVAQPQPEPISLRRA